MDTGRSTTYTGGFKFATEPQIESSGFLGTRRGWKNIRWYEYTFLMLGILAVLVTDSLSIARLVKVETLKDPDFAYGILILVHSIFLLAFLITGIFYQRTTDIIAFFLSAILLTTYVVVHYFARRNNPNGHDDSQLALRTVRLGFTIFFNICFVPLTFLVIKDYRRDEFSKRLFGAFPTARWPLKIYSIFACIARINTMLSISTLLLNLYHYAGYEIVDLVLLAVGVPLVFLWLGFGIGMARLESYLLSFLFFFVSLFQLGFLAFSLYTAIENSKKTSNQSTTTTTTTTSGSATVAPAANLLPTLNVLYVCISINFLSHILSIIFGIICIRQFKKGLKERVFTSKIDQWFHQRWSSH